MSNGPVSNGPVSSQLNETVCGKSLTNLEDIRRGLSAQSSIKAITGFDIAGCPWFSYMHNPLVQEVLKLMHEYNQNPACFNDQLPADLYDAFLLFQETKTRAHNHWMNIAHEQAKSEAKSKSKSMNGPKTKGSNNPADYFNR